MIEPREAIHVGDRMRISVELVERFHENPFSRSYLVVVQAIEFETETGVLTVWLRSLEDPPP
jgi:hypothetical protein